MVVVHTQLSLYLLIDILCDLKVAHSKACWRDLPI